MLAELRAAPTRRATTDGFAGSLLAPAGEHLDRFTLFICVFDNDFDMLESFTISPRRAPSLRNITVKAILHGMMKIQRRRGRSHG